MSRMGKKPIVVDPKVTLEISGQEVRVTGPKGTLSYELPEGITVKQDGGVLQVLRALEDDKEQKMKHGLVRSLVNSMIIGTSVGFKRELELSGVGYRAQLAGQKLTMSLGYSKPIEYTVPEGVKVSMADQTHITLEGIDKQLVGQVAATIRNFRVPDAYHGKGVRYLGEQITLKEGKKVGA
jgi:large subunit ribosomal protein L6